MPWKKVRTVNKIREEFVRLVFAKGANISAICANKVNRIQMKWLGATKRERRWRIKATGRSTRRDESPRRWKS